MPHNPLYTAKAIVFGESATHGYGVFAQRDLAEGELLEECPYIPLYTSWHSLDDNIKDYLFSLVGTTRYTSSTLQSEVPNAVVAGHALIYNHSVHPNVDYKISTSKRIFKFYTSEDVGKDEELFVSYGENSHSATRIKEKIDHG